MFSVFHESGIFMVTHWHCFVLLACNMIKSGGLCVRYCVNIVESNLFYRAKYPLVIINSLLSTYGANGGCAYDTGCTFVKMVEARSLGLKVCDLKLCFMVGSFHGHAHNRKCQLNWHPMYIKGTGHTKGEGCEHVFSSLNLLACGVHHASWFHWHQAVEQHFGFWNEGKYEALCILLI